MDLNRLLQSTKEPKLDLAPTPGEETTMRLGPNITAQIKHKIDVMNAHWRDYDRLFTARTHRATDREGEYEQSNYGSLQPPGGTGDSQDDLAANSVCDAAVLGFAFLDRINIGFAALTMNQDVGLTAQMFGF